MEISANVNLQRLPTPNSGTSSNSRVPPGTSSNSRVLPGTSSNNRENDADRTSRNSSSAIAIAPGSSQRVRASLTRHNAVMEPNEYGRRAVDPSDNRENPYSDARSAGLLYLENNATVYPENGNRTAIRKPSLDSGRIHIQRM